VVILCITLLLSPSWYYQFRFSLIRKIIFSVYLLVSVSLTQNIQQRILGYQIKNETENLKSNVQNEHRRVSVHLHEKFCPRRRVKTKFGTRRREEKLYWLEIDVHPNPINAVGKDPMSHKCVKVRKVQS